MANKNGGPAFPRWGMDEKGNLVDCHGMTLRDWFAGQALCGLMATPSGTRPAANWAQEAYWIADAMMKARNAAMLAAEEPSA